MWEFKTTLFSSFLYKLLAMIPGQKLILAQSFLLPGLWTSWNWLIFLHWLHSSDLVYDSINLIFLLYLNLWPDSQCCLDSQAKLLWYLICSNKTIALCRWPRPEVNRSYVFFHLCKHFHFSHRIHDILTHLRGRKSQTKQTMYSHGVFGLYHLP